MGSAESNNSQPKCIEVAPIERDSSDEEDILDKLTSMAGERNRSRKTNTSLYRLDVTPVTDLLSSLSESSPELETPPSLQTKSSNDPYDLSKKAYVLVFHHYKFQDKTYDRDGSKSDMASIRKCFQNYRCDTLDVNENLTKQKVEQKMKQISKKDFSGYSCLVVFIMSHGNTNDTIMAYDGQMYSFHTEIVEECTSNGTLKDKPKIFVLQACRGNAEIVTDAKRVMSDKSDIVTFQSSYQGAVSYRHIEQGSFFMQAFIRLLHEHNGQNIINVNRELNRYFKDNQILQTPTLSTTLRKDLIFGHLLRE